MESAIAIDSWCHQCLIQEILIYKTLENHKIYLIELSKGKKRGACTYQISSPIALGWGPTNIILPVSTRVEVPSSFWRQNPASFSCCLLIGLLWFQWLSIGSFEISCSHIWQILYSFVLPLVQMLTEGRYRGGCWSVPTYLYFGIRRDTLSPSLDIIVAHGFGVLLCFYAGICFSTPFCPPVTFLRKL